MEGVSAPGCFDGLNGTKVELFLQDRDYISAASRSIFMEPMGCDVDLRVGTSGELLSKFPLSAREITFYSVISYRGRDKDSSKKQQFPMD